MKVSLLITDMKLTKFTGQFVEESNKFYRGEKTNKQIFKLNNIQTNKLMKLELSI